MCKIAAIAGQAGERSDLCRDALHRLENGVEVIVLEQFCLAELQHVSVNAALDQSGVQPVGPLKGLVDGLGGVRSANLAVFTERHSAESQDGIESVPS